MPHGFELDAWRARWRRATSTHIGAFAALIALVAAFLGPIVVRGDVAFPHDNSIEVGVQDFESTRLSSRKFSDASSAFIPELHQHLNGPRDGWLSLWNPHVELGRPTWQIQGLSKAFIVTHALSWLTHDALRLSTWLVLATLAATAVFGYLFFAELGLHPWACFAASAALALSVYDCFWLTFVMLPAGACWTLCILWLVARWCRAPSIAVGLGLAFAVHALFLTAYPQQLVVSAWMIVAFTLWRSWTSVREVRARVRRAFGLAAFATLGLVSIVPVYADLFEQARSSARLGANTEFFLGTMPQISRWSELSVFLSQFFDPLWSGNPILNPYAFRFFKGISFTPLLGGLAAIAWMDGGWRRTWGWSLFLVVCLLSMLWRPVYRLEVEHLGLNLSRFVPFGGAMIPCAVLAAFAIDHVLRRGLARRWLATIVIAALLGVSIDAQRNIHLALTEGYAIAGIAFFLGGAVFVWTRSELVLAILVVGGAFHYGARLLLVRPEADVRVDSDLVDAVRARTEDGSRFAWIGAVPKALPCNEEAWLGLASIHSYDSLSSERYQRWLLDVSTEGARTLGRKFDHISDESKLESAALRRGGVGLLMSTQPLQSASVHLIERVGDVRLYRPSAAPLLCAQVPLHAVVGTEGPRSDVARGRRRGSDVIAAGDEGDPWSFDSEIELAQPIESLSSLPIERLPGSDDHQRYRVTADEESTLVWLSQQYHPRWIALSGSTPLHTVCVDGFYQGVIVPAHVGAIELEFRPWSRWSWLPQLFFAAAGAVVVLRRMLRATVCARSPSVP
jgi:hypothetical protein